MPVRFRGITVREGALIEGRPGGEFSPFAGSTAEGERSRMVWPRAVDRDAVADRPRGPADRALSFGPYSANGRTPPPGRPSISALRVP